jgi:excisionase family DNA binding protein
MSSNINIERKCIYCGNIFNAKTYVTKYCSHTCNRRHYKQIKKSDRTQNPQSLPTHAIIGAVLAPLVNEYLSISETATALRLSDRSIFRMLNKKVIQPIKVGRRVLIPKQQLNKMLEYENKIAAEKN